MLTRTLENGLVCSTGRDFGWSKWLAWSLAANLLLSTLSARGGWNVAIERDLLTDQPRCLLRSDPVITAAGHEDTTPVSLIFNGTSLLVLTQSELDDSLADLRLTVDKNPPIQSTKIIQKTALLFDQNFPDLLRQLREGHEATLHLRFWPTWPITQSFPVSFNLTGFTKAHEMMNQNCASTASVNPAPR